MHHHDDGAEFNVFAAFIASINANSINEFFSAVLLKCVSLFKGRNMFHLGQMRKCNKNQNAKRRLLMNGAIVSFASIATSVLATVCESESLFKPILAGL